MTGRVSWMIRRARSAARRRGVPFDRVLPYAEVSLGALLGLVCGALAWGAVAAWLVDQSAEQTLEVFAGGGRDAEAAAAVASAVASAKFQDDWLSQDALPVGLRGSRRLRAEAVRTGSRDAPRHEVVLCCEGRPGRAVAQALAAANRRALALEGRLTLRPSGYDRERSRLTAELAKLVGEQEKIEKEQAEVKTEQAPRPDDAPRDREREGAARAAREEADRRLQDEVAKAQGLSERLNVRKRELAALEGVKPLDAGDFERRRVERADIEQRLRGVSREDCTPEHPLVRRLADIDRQLRRAELPGEIAETERQLAEAGARIETLRREAERARENERAAKTRPQGTGTAGEAVAQASDSLAKRKAANERKQADKREELRALDAAPPTRIAIRPAGQAVAHPPPGGALVLLLAAALGAGLALLFHFKVAPGFSLIDDRESLAERLQVPVLGVVPRLAALERR